MVEAATADPKSWAAARSSNFLKPRIAIDEKTGANDVAGVQHTYIWGGRERTYCVHGCILQRADLHASVLSWLPAEFPADCRFQIHCVVGHSRSGLGFFGRILRLLNYSAGGFFRFEVSSSLGISSAGKHLLVIEQTSPIAALATARFSCTT